jgi:hypothetical protein
MFLLRVFVVVLGCWHSFFVIVYNGNRSLWDRMKKKGLSFNY